MRLLDNAVIKDHYDVIVVGSGIGGLTAAALLAKKGIDVLVIEQHYLPGGACTTMRRRDVTFDVGVAMMFGFGPQGFNPHRYIMNVLEEDINIIPHDSLYQMKIGGKKLTFWRDFERFFKELVAIFPHQEKELRNLYDYFYKLYKNMILKNPIVVPPSEMPPIENLKMLIKNPVGILSMIPLMFKNTESIVNKFITDPEVKAFFNMLTCTYCYCNAKETPATLSGALFSDNHYGGAYYPSGSPQMLSNKLEKAIEKYGGQLLYRNCVDEILIEKGKAYGVRLANDIQIESDRVISNGTIWNLYGKLVRSKHIKPKRMEWAQSFVPTFGSVAVYLGVDSKAIPKDTPPILMFVGDMHNITGNDITVYISSMDEPALCPAGMHSVTIVQPSMKKWPRPFDPKYRSEEYQKQKKEEAEKLITLVEGHFPELRKHIKIMDVGTPSTIERFTLKNWGAVGGPKMMMGQDMIKRLHARSEWKNLYLCGDSTVMGIGIPATSISGVGAANMVLRDLGMKEYLPKNFEKEYIHYVKGSPWIPSPPADEPITEKSAERIAKDCQHCEKPECMAACPAGIETCNFARRIESGNFAGAARALREVNPLSEICGYVCPSEKFCEKKCSRLEFDNRPVRIRELHGWVCGHVSNDEGWSPVIDNTNGYKIAVIGAGPSGLTCAHYLARLGYYVDVIEKSDTPGGIPAQAIPSFRLPYSTVKREITGLSYPNINFQYGKALGKDFRIGDIDTSYDAIFIAPGLWKGKLLDMPGINNVKTRDALTFLKQYKSGQKLDMSGNVLVIGGGSVASDAAITAKKAGASKVTLVCLEKENEMPALQHEIVEMKKQGIEIINRFGPEKFISDRKISFIACTSVFDSSGRFAPMFDENISPEREFDHVIFAVGQSVDQELSDYFKREFGAGDRLNINFETMQIKDRPGLYAGGDIVRGPSTVAEAVGDGRRAARGIDNFLQKKYRQ